MVCSLQRTLNEAIIHFGRSGIPTSLARYTNPQHLESTIYSAHGPHRDGATFWSVTFYQMHRVSGTSYLRLYGIPLARCRPFTLRLLGSIFVATVEPMLFLFRRGGGRYSSSTIDSPIQRNLLYRLGTNSTSILGSAVTTSVIPCTTLLLAYSNAQSIMTAHILD